MKKTAVVIILITILSKLIGFSRDITLSYFFGATGVSDAYLISLIIPGVIAGFIGIGISTGYIPILTSVEKKGNLETGVKFTNNLINLSIVVYTVLFLIGMVFTEVLVKLFASGFDEDTFLLAVKFSRITISGIYFTGIVHIYRGYLQVRGSYFVPELALIPMNIIAILSIILAFNYNLAYLAYGRVIAIASQIILMIPWLIKYGYKYQPSLLINDEYIKRIVYIGLPIILGVSVNEINILVDRTLASQIAVGGITALNYASRLSGFIQGIFVVSISTALYPIISKYSAEKKYNKLKSSANGAFFGVSALILPASIGSLIFSKEIINLLFGRGAFDESALILTSSALFFYSFGMMGIGWREILSRIFYSMQDTKTPMRNAAVGMTLNIILNIILSRFLGIGGLALATSISALFTAGLLLYNLRKKIGPLGMKQISISFLKILFAALIMGLIAKFSFTCLTTSLSQNLSLVLAIGVGAASYFVIIYFMKIEDVDVIVGAIKKKLSRVGA